MSIIMQLYFVLLQPAIAQRVLFILMMMQNLDSQSQIQFIRLITFIIITFPKSTPSSKLLKINNGIYFSGFLLVLELQLIVLIYKMSLIVNYLRISLQEWERNAQAACFEIKQELKSEAQRFFCMFMQAPNLQRFLELINNGSDTLLFVLFSCASKSNDFFSKNLNNFAVLVQNILGWQLRGLTFVRQNMPPLQQYVARTVMITLGIFLKGIYKREESNGTVIKYLSQLSDGYFKLYLLRSFIEAIENIDYEMGYMKYRCLIYHFQDHVIPFICETLMPFFYRVQENIQVGQLSILQQNLRVNQNELMEEYSQKLSLLTREQEYQADYIFLLLKTIIEFNYNISYNEYESQNTQQINLVSFPDKVIEKMINGEFIKAFFFILEKIASIKMGNKQNEYLLIGLNCLSRLMQSRLSTLEQPIKQVYILEAIKGINRIIPKCINIGNSAILQGILQCNKKFLVGCQLSFIKATFAKHQNNISQYHTFIKYLTSLIEEIIKVTSISYQNQLFFQALETANKILVNFGCRDEDFIDEQGLFFVKFAQTIVSRFIDNLCQPKRIFASANIVNIGDNKQVVHQLFQSIKKLGTYNYQYFFSTLQNKINNLVSNMDGQLIILANILFLLSEILEKGFLERTPFLHKATQSQISILGRIINKATHLAKYYMNTRKVYFKKQATYIDLATILFTEAITVQFLLNFQCNNGIKIKHKLYFQMIYQKSETQMWNPNQDTKSQETILEYINILLGFLEGCLIANKEDEIKILYVLEVIQRCIFKLKWNSKRDVYLKTEIFQFLESFISRFFNEFHFMVSIRSKTAKILVTLTFDDIMDEYKFRISKFINIVKVQSLTSILYDLIGAFEGLQTLIISIYFYNKLKKEIQLRIFFNSIIQQAYMQHNQTLFKDCCKLIKFMVNNKGLKVGNNITAYQIFSVVLQSLIWICKQIRQKIQFDFDFWSDSLCQIIQMMNFIINGTHINIFLMDDATQLSNKSQDQPFTSSMKQFWFILFAIINKIVPSQIKLYPRLEELVLVFYNSISKDMLPYILQDDENKLVYQFTIMHFKFIDLIIEYMKEILGGSKAQEDKLIKSIDTARWFYSYSQKKSKIIHKAIILNNLQRIFNAFTNSDVNENKHQTLIFYSFSFILTNYKSNLTILRPIAKFLYWMSKMFKQSLVKSIIQLKISNFMVGQFQHILKKQQLSEDAFVDEFKHWTKRSDQY